MTFKTSIADVFKALRSTLSRAGVKIGGTASYPRVEIHSVVEGEPMDKGSRLRPVTCTIECVTDTKVADIVTLVEQNIARIFGQAGMSMANWDVVGFGEGQVRMFEEQDVNDQNKVIYRLLQDITIWVEQTN